MCLGKEEGFLRTAAFRRWLGLRYVLKEDSRETEEIKSRGSLGKTNLKQRTFMPPCEKHKSVRRGIFHTSQRIQMMVPSQYVEF